MAKVYRLMSGKVSRPNKEGVMEIHKAPYEFTPTSGEYSANKFRLKFVRDGAEDGSKVAVAETVEVGKPPTDVRQMSANTAVDFMKTVITEDELDIYLLQESDNKPKPRRRVIEAIELKRKELLGQFDADFVERQIAASETAAE